VEGRKTDGSQALAGLPQRWHVKGGFFFNFGNRGSDDSSGSDPRSSAVGFCLPDHPITPDHPISLAPSASFAVK
jgi:hypothetical protein